MSTRLNFPVLIAAIALMASCSSTQPVAQHNDDVYFIPSQAPPKPAKPVEQAPATAAAPSDDYYDGGTSQDLGTNRGFYDMAYNDPYYYNYGRFGFGMGMMGWQTGWNGPGWGMGFGWGDPWMNMNIGWGGGWNRPWGFNDPWGWNRPLGWNRPWGWGNPWNDPYGWGYGYGSYWGPMGPCSWYSPIMLSSNVVVGHRPGISHVGASGGTDVRQPRMAVRNPISLQPVVNHRSLDRGGLEQRDGLRDRGTMPETRPGTTIREPGRQPAVIRPGVQETPRRGSFEMRPSIGRGGDGGGSMPSRSGGGGGGGTPMRRAR